MTDVPDIVDEAEAVLRSTATELTRPRESECLCCYVGRMLDAFPCDGSLRCALHFRDVVAPRATALARRLEQLGGFCDCEIFMNGYQPADPGADIGDAAPPPCAGVRRGSVQPCRQWVRIRFGSGPY